MNTIYKLILTAAAAMILPSAANAAGNPDMGEPTFSCSHAISVLPRILCSAPEAAQADWDLDAASRAYYADKPEEADKENDKWAKSILVKRCGLADPITAVETKCVANEYRRRAGWFRDQLRARRWTVTLAESNLDPGTHIAIQNALILRGFLRNDLPSYGADPDDQFGPNTRLAIRRYQASIGAKETGVLSQEQIEALLDAASHKEARAETTQADGGAWAQERSAQEARHEQDHTDREALAEEAPARAEETRQQRLEAERAQQAERERIAEEARQQRLEAERKHQEELQRQERAEEERRQLENKRKEWRTSIDEAKEKGPAYAEQSKILWSSKAVENEMEDDYVVESIQPNGSGAVARVDGSCVQGKVQFVAVLYDDTDPKTPLALPGMDPTQKVVGGLKKVNDEPKADVQFPNDGFRNRIRIDSISSVNSIERGDQLPDESMETTWRVLAQVETSKGPLLIKVPMFESHVQELVERCKKQDEIIKRRNGQMPSIE